MFTGKVLPYVKLPICRMHGAHHCCSAYFGCDANWRRDRKYTVFSTENKHLTTKTTLFRHNSLQLLPSTVLRACWNFNSALGRVFPWQLQLPQIPGLPCEEQSVKVCCWPKFGDVAADLSMYQEINLADFQIQVELFFWKSGLSHLYFSQRCCWHPDKYGTTPMWWVQ